MSEPGPVPAPGAQTPSLLEPPWSQGLCLPLGLALSQQSLQGASQGPMSSREDGSCVERTILAEKTEIPAELKINRTCWLCANASPGPGGR